MVGSCWILDADRMATMGQLQPGWAGTCQFPLGAGNGVLAITLRAKAGRLIVSWRSPTTIMSGSEADGEEGGADVGLDDVTKLVIPVELVRHFDGSYRFYFRCPGTDTSRETDNASTDNASTDNASTDNASDARRACGRRALKLHFVRHLHRNETPGLPGSSVTGDEASDEASDEAGDEAGSGRYRFLCRRCSGLVYAGPYETSRQRALRRANKLWQRLAGAIMSGTEEAAEAAQLIAGALQAETQATEACTAQIQRLIAWLDQHRDKPQFTL
jgi:hypothetical protein